MDLIVQNLKVWWRSERLLKKKDINLMTQKIQCNALAGFVAIFGLVMLTIAAFFALVPYLGQALAALAVATIDLGLAGVLIIYGRSLKPGPEVEMVIEMRDMALTNIGDEVSRIEAELAALKKDVHKLIRNPVDVLLPHAIIPLISAFGRGKNTDSKK